MTTRKPLNRVAGPPSRPRFEDMSIALDNLADCDGADPSERARLIQIAIDTARSLGVDPESLDLPEEAREVLRKIPK